MAGFAGTTLRRLRSSWSVQTGTDLTSEADQYSAKARECEERAEQTRDPFIKQQMIDIAQKWHTMAAYEDQYGRTRSSTTASGSWPGAIPSASGLSPEGVMIGLPANHSWSRR